MTPTAVTLRCRLRRSMDEKNMRRFDTLDSNDMFRRVDGPWVRYDDAKAEIAAIAEERDKANEGFIAVVIERDKARAEIAAVTAELDVAKARVFELETGIAAAMDWAANRWDEWGPRAENTYELLSAAFERRPPSGESASYLMAAMDDARAARVGKK